MMQAKKLELKDCLIHDLQEKKRVYENYRHTAELSTGGGCKYYTRLKFLLSVM